MASWTIRFTAIALLLLGEMLLCPAFVLGQKGIYADYPQKRGKTQLLFVPHLPSWVDLSMEDRGRFEGQTSYSYGEGNDRIYALTRVYGAVEMRPTRFATTYLQFIDVHALGLPSSKAASNMRDAFDLRQGYLQLHFNPGDLPIALSVGREEMRFGSERIIGISDWTNTSRTWDGFFGRIGDKNRLDLFSTSVVTVHPTSLDKHGAGLTFHGAYGSLEAWIPHTHVSPFVVVRAVRSVTSHQQIKGSEFETTFGMEVEGAFPANFCYMVNGALQRGSYSNDSIHSGETFEKLFYTARQMPWTPRIGVEYDYATGNAQRIPYRISTYDQLYPSNHNAFGLVDLFGFQNIRQERVNLDLAPSKNLTLLLQGERLRLAERHDSLYASGGSVTIKAPATGFSSTHLGEGLDLSGKYVFHKFIVANIGVGHLFPGRVLIDHQHGSAETIAYFSLTYRIRAERAEYARKD